LIKRNALLIALLLTLGSTSSAVLIDSGDGTGNTTAPSPDPGWRNIGVCNGLSVTYIGDGWVLSAAHVGAKPVAIDGNVYPAVEGTHVTLQYSDAVQSDVALFRINPYPKNLPVLPIRTHPVSVAEPILMVGNGHIRAGATNWNKTGSISGYFWSKRKGLRWGTNVVSGAEVDLVAFGKTTHSFYTNFTRGGTRHEAHATTGDSGGPVFTRTGDGWELAGVLYATKGFAGQPNKSTIYGNLTYVSDLSFYRDQVIAVTTPSCGNGHLTIDEQCDDGNTIAGDCCSATCQFEAATTSCNDELVCTINNTCDGAGVCSEGDSSPCDDADPCTADSCDEASGCLNTPIESAVCTA
jgi:cysteine-rich repeat protein